MTEETSMPEPKTTRRKRAAREAAGAAVKPAPETRPRAHRPLLSEPEGGRYFNRDESWLQFNRRVLDEASDASNPLLERVKFLAITATNLDEFIEIRVAGVLQRLEEEMGLAQKPDEGGLSQDERAKRLQDRLHSFSDEQALCWQKKLVPALGEAGIRLVQWKQLREADRLFAAKFFQEQVDPLLTPVTLDPAHPFPRVLNKSLCLALLLRYKRKTKSGGSKVLGVVTIPRSLPGLVALPERDGKRAFLLLEDLIEAHVGPMFRGYNVLACSAFRVTRNSNLYMQEEESKSLLENVAEELHNRRKGDVVRMEIDGGAPGELMDRLRDKFELEPWQIFPTSAPVNLGRLMKLYSSVSGDAAAKLKFADFHGRRPKFPRGNIFTAIESGDVMLHHPFDSYNTVEEFIATACADPDVVSIKQTLYRTSAESPIFEALSEAAQTKDVTVVVELMARFDEASNIRWAREMEDDGVQVFHGIYGYKTHCKLALVVRRCPDGTMRSYAHLGTGNYNPVTSRFYTDISLLTCRTDITDAVQKVFRFLTADWEAGESAYRPLLVAPVTLARDIAALVVREAEHARAGRPAKIIAKMNGLLDGPTIDALYAASQAGVEIDLIVRGMCALRPGVPGLSERIRVRSIVGRFLEHSRIFWFTNDGNEEVFAGSADWMPRNLYERCEVVFPVCDAAARQRLRGEILETYLRDTKKAWELRPDGTYARIGSGKAVGFSAQDYFMELSTTKA